MKVFISWSGERSRRFGQAIRVWLPRVLQSVEPYFSETDIEIGSRWHNEIIGALEASDVGLIILTPENITRQWIMFEAGAIVRSVGGGRVCPILFDLKKLDLKGPLWHFQPVEFTENDFRKLLNTINGGLEKKLAEADLNDVFDTYWPKLKDQIEGIAAEAQAIDTPKERTEKELLEENLSLTRALLTEQQKLNQALMSWLRIPQPSGAVAQVVSALLAGESGLQAKASSPRGLLDMFHTEQNEPTEQGTRKQRLLDIEIEPTEQGTVLPGNK